MVGQQHWLDDGIRSPRHTLLSVRRTLNGVAPSPAAILINALRPLAPLPSTTSRASECVSSAAVVHSNESRCAVASLALAVRQTVFAANAAVSLRYACT